MYSERFFCLLIKKHPFLDIYSSLEELLGALFSGGENRERTAKAGSNSQRNASSTNFFIVIVVVLLLHPSPKEKNQS